MSRTCVVCGKVVIETDIQEHLSAAHLGPHYFWFNAKKYRTMEPSMKIIEIVKMVDASTIYQVYEDRDGHEIPWSHGASVDLTQEPHFFALPPATM